jgi:undecaprenyl phosphate N,N'-diacetylbacillosamine 1-phosphate transferase
MYAHFVKRICDIVIGLVALPFVLLAIIVIAPFVFFEDRGPLFYNAPRIGKGGKPFTMYKFRSMQVDAPDLRMPDGSTYNAPDDPRMTHIGALLRRTSLDEFPQFLNVLIGNMSFIGPRPDVEEETELYEGDEARKLEVKPGITGYAAAYARNSIPWKERLKLDVYYVDHVSFAFDVRIFFKTIGAVLGQKGIYTSPESLEGLCPTPNDPATPRREEKGACDE